MISKVPLRKLKMNKEHIKKSVLSRRKKYVEKLPLNITKEFEVDIIKETASKSYRLQPPNFNGEYIFYLYGGGMCENIRAEQWEFIAKVAMRTGYGVLVPMYPLAPEHSCRELFEMLETTYRQFAMRHDVKVILGDSSGAGLALSLSILAWEKGLQKPDKMILISPIMDTEFFDKGLEEKVLASASHDKKYYFSEAVKDFLNSYWVKDYAVKTKYTSPYYEDCTDLSDEITIFSGTDDMFNCYSREFYNKVKMQGIDTKFFEFEDQGHNFMIHSKSEESEKAFEYLIDIINGTYYASLSDVLPLKMLTEWGKKYPEIIKDEWAAKFIYNNKFDFKGNLKGIKFSEYKNLLFAERCAFLDDKASDFILQYPDCTIINIGCRLDNMFERVDNGRIQWYNIDTHNIMSVRRSMYGERDREKTIGRSITDLSWIDDIECEKNKGVLFISNESFSYMSMSNMKKIVNKIWHKFPGCDLVFSAVTTGTAVYNNIRYRKSMIMRDRYINSINDASTVFGNWRTDYIIKAEDPVMKNLKMHVKKVNLKTKIFTAYNLLSYNYKIIHVRLGYESYEVKS